MKLIRFTAKCQRVSISDQYFKYGVRCFDLRVRFDSGVGLILCHGPIEYDFRYYEFIGDLEWMALRGDVTLRLLLDLRGVPEDQYDFQRKKFNAFYREILKPFHTIKCILGRDLPTWKKCIVTIPDGKVIEKYSSVTKPKYIDDWFPYLYARFKNKKIKETYLDEANEDILLIDFVDI